MSEVDSEADLKQQIRKQVDRTGSLVTGEFNKAEEQELAKYVVSVHQATETLESLCTPVIDEKYREKEKEHIRTVDNLAKSVDNKEYDNILENAQRKFRFLIRLLHRKGVL